MRTENEQNIDSGRLTLITVKPYKRYGNGHSLSKIWYGPTKTENILNYFTNFNRFQLSHHNQPLPLLKILLDIK